MVPGDLLTRLLALLIVIASAAALVVGVRTIGRGADASEVRVARVAGGDSLELETGEQVRLVQIDAPELGEGECWARESRAVLATLVRDRSVRLVADPAVRAADEDRADRFGRLLRYVFVGDVNVNVELVRRGAAAPWFFAGVRGRYARQLVAAARSARERRVGLWRACARTRLDPTAPVDTRQ